MKASTLILVFVVLFLTMIITVLATGSGACSRVGIPQGGCQDTIKMGASVDVVEAIKAIQDEW